MTNTPEVTSYSDPEHIATAHESGMTYESAMDAVRNGYAVTREGWNNGCVFKISYLGRSYIVNKGNSVWSGIYPYGWTPPLWSHVEDRNALDWKVVERAALWETCDNLLFAGELES